MCQNMIRMRVATFWLSSLPWCSKLGPFLIKRSIAFKKPLNPDKLYVVSPCTGSHQSSGLHSMKWRASICLWFLAVGVPSLMGQCPFLGSMWPEGQARIYLDFACWVSCFSSLCTEEDSGCWRISNSIEKGIDGIPPGARTCQPHPTSTWISIHMPLATRLYHLLSQLQRPGRKF